MKRLVLILVILALAGSASAQAAPTDAPLVQQARDANTEGNAQLALDLANKAITENPKSAEAYAQKGYAELLLNATEVGLNTAGQDIDHALELDDGNESAWYAAGILALRLNTFRTAAAIFEKVTELNPASTEAWIYQGVAYSKKAMYAQAKPAFEKALQLSPGNAVVQKNLAFVNERLAEGKGPVPMPWEPAGNATIKSWTAEMAKTPPDAAAARKKKDFARKYMATRPDNYVMECAQYAVIFAPNDSDAWAVAGWVSTYRDERQMSEAPILWVDGLAMFNKALELDSNNAEARRGKAYAEARLGDFDDAIADYQATLALNGNDAAAKQGLSQAQTDRARYKRSFDLSATYSLAIAIRHEREAFVVSAIDRGAFPDVLMYRKDSFHGGNITVFHYAAMRNLPWAALRLSDAGADVNAKDKDGQTVLMPTIEHYFSDHPKAIHLAVRVAEFADNPGKMPGYENKTPERVAFDRQAFAVVAILISRGADMNQATGDSSTLLTDCATHCPSSAFAYFLKNGADVNTTTRWGSLVHQTLLDINIGNYYLLLDAGAKDEPATLADTQSFVGLIDAAPAGSPLRQYIDALKAGDRVRATLAAQTLKLSPAMMNQALMAAFPLNDYNLTMALIKSGANPNATIMGLSYASIAEGRNLNNVSGAFHNSLAASPQLAAEAFADRLAEIDQLIAHAELTYDGAIRSIRTGTAYPCTSLSKAQFDIDYASKQFNTLVREFGNRPELASRRQRINTLVANYNLGEESYKCNDVDDDGSE